MSSKILHVILTGRLLQHSYAFSKSSKNLEAIKQDIRAEMPSMLNVRKTFLTEFV